MFLARTVFHTSVKRTQQICDAREFQEWQELYRIEPWGDDWMQAGVIAATSVNLWSKKKVKPEQFIPKEKSTRRKTPQQMEAEMQHFARMHNAIAERKEKQGKQ